MKNALLYIIVFTIFVCSCKKKEPIPSPLSQWTIDTVTFKGYTDRFVNGIDGVAKNSPRESNYGKDFIEISFVYFYLPSKSGKFKVKSRITDSSECRIVVSVVGSSSNEYVSEDSNSEVTITVSNSGKLTASFANITLRRSYNGTDTKTVSGTLVEQ